MKIVAISDLHGRLPDIPECDVLLIAGDLCPDSFTNRIIVGFDPDQSRREQNDWLEEQYRPWERRVPAGRILMTPGNHDWIVRMPEGFKTEFYVDESVEIAGRRFYFTPWIPKVTGTWNYELDTPRRAAAFDPIPSGLDVLVTHAPAYGVVDSAYGNVPAGCRILRSILIDRKPKVHVFGHIHEGQRTGRTERREQTTHTNVAMWGNNWTPYSFEI